MYSNASTTLHVRQRCQISPKVNLPSKVTECHSICLDYAIFSRVAWRQYVLNVLMQMLCLCVGCLIYAKYHQCDPLRANLISRPDQVSGHSPSLLMTRLILNWFSLQLYPLFVTEIFGRFPGFTGLFISSILSATLSTFSSGVNSMATVVLEDIYKRLAPQSTVNNERQVQFTKILCKSSMFIVNRDAQRSMPIESSL